MESGVGISRARQRFLLFGENYDFWYIDKAYRIYGTAWKYSADALIEDGNKGQNGRR